MVLPAPDRMPVAVSSAALPVETPAHQPYDTGQSPGHFADGLFVGSRRIYGAEQAAESASGKEVVVKLVSPLEWERCASPELDVFVIQPIAPIAKVPLTISNGHAHSGFHNDKTQAACWLGAHRLFASSASAQYPQISYPVVMRKELYA